MEETLKVIHCIRHAGRGRIKLGYLNFDTLRRISPPAALVLAAEIDLWNRYVGRKLRARTAGWDPQILSLLSEMGFFDLLHIDRNAEVELVQKNTVFLKFLSDNVKNGSDNEGELARQLRRQIEAFAGQINKQQLFQGLSEAMANVHHHAYPSPSGFKSTRFWMSASFSVASRRLTVMFYDQGIGIPATLPASRLTESVREKIFAWSDAQRIRAAIETPRTSTGVAGRGHGIQDMLKFIKKHSWGRFSIISFRGKCDVFHSKDQTDGLEYSTKLFGRKLKGTLISWEVLV